MVPNIIYIYQAADLIYTSMKKTCNNSRSMQSDEQKVKIMLLTKNIPKRAKMRNINYVFHRKLITLLILIIPLHGCSKKNKNVADVSESTPIYKTEREFTFLASHFDKEGYPIKEDTLVLKTKSKIVNEKYGQTSSTWLSPSGHFRTSYSGITEHDTAVWIHPPREGVYKKLELSPFPMVQFPLEVGNSWTWSLEIGSHYSVKGHAEWPDTAVESFVSNYRITDELTISTKIGLISTYEINSYTKSNFDRTELKAFFNPDYGFVILEYMNIDRGRINIELIDVKSIKSNLGSPLKQL